MGTKVEFFATEEEVRARKQEIKDNEQYNFIMLSGFLPNNPKGKQWGIQWGDISEED